MGSGQVTYEELAYVCDRAERRVADEAEQPINDDTLADWLKDCHTEHGRLVVVVVVVVCVFFDVLRTLFAI